MGVGSATKFYWVQGLTYMSWLREARHGRWRLKESCGRAKKAVKD
jgi:hypothetical protein